MKLDYTTLLIEYVYLNERVEIRNSPTVTHPELILANSRFPNMVVDVKTGNVIIEVEGYITVVYASNIKSIIYKKLDKI